MNVRFLALADQEVDEAVAWYDQQGEDISRGFLDDLDSAVRLAKTYPYWRRSLNLNSVDSCLSVILIP